MGQIVVFKLGNEEYGIDIMKVVEIVRYQEIRHVPDTPNYIEGIVNLRGSIHPIYNLKTRFHMKQKDINDDTKIIIIRAKENNIGFIVDNVTEILNISDNNIEDAPHIISMGVDKNFISGIAKENGRMIVMLDIDKLITSEELELLEKIVDE